MTPWPKPNRVYFIKPVGMIGPIKIGASSVPEDRLKTLSVWSPIQLEIIATIPGDYKLEQKLHLRFADSHSHLEWFHASTDLLLLIERLRSGMDVDLAIDLDSAQGSIRKKPQATPAFKRLRSYQSRLMWVRRRHQHWPDTVCYLPDRVEQVMHEWSRTKVEPAPDDLAHVEDVIANPLAHVTIKPLNRRAA